MTPSTNVKILVHIVTVVIAVLGKHVGVNEDELHLIRESFFGSDRSPRCQDVVRVSVRYIPQIMSSSSILKSPGAI